MKFVLPALAAILVAAGGIYLATRERETPPPASRSRDSGLRDSGLRDSGLRDSGLQDSGLQDSRTPFVNPAMAEESRRRLEEYWKGHMADYYRQENERRLAELKKLLTLSDAELATVREAFDRERDAFLPIWESLKSQDPSYVESAGYKAQIDALVEPADALMRALLDAKRLEKYRAWRGKYDRGRYFYEWDRRK